MTWAAIAGIYVCLVGLYVSMRRISKQLDELGKREWTIELSGKSRQRRG